MERTMERTIRRPERYGLHTPCDYEHAETSVRVRVRIFSTSISLLVCLWHCKELDDTTQAEDSRLWLSEMLESCDSLSVWIGQQDLPGIFERRQLDISGELWPAEDRCVSDMLIDAGKAHTFNQPG